MIVQWWMFLFFLILVLFTSVVFANPFDSFENELKDYIDSENNQNSELDPELRDLFQPDNKDDNYDFKCNCKKGYYGKRCHMETIQLIFIGILTLIIMFFIYPIIIAYQNRNKFTKLKQIIQINKAKINLKYKK